jgi:hypothetical protein
MRGDELGIGAAQVRELRADQLPPSPEEGGIVRLEMEIRDFFLKSDFQNLLKCLNVHDSPSLLIYMVELYSVRAG